MKHIHAELMVQYAQDAMETDKPWERWEFFSRTYDCWVVLEENPCWYANTYYRRRIKAIDINGYGVPEPVRIPLEKDTMYYIPVTNLSGKFYDWHIWAGDAWDECFLKRGMIHLSEEAAILHAKALLSFTTKDTDEK